MTGVHKYRGATYKSKLKHGMVDRRQVQLERFPPQLRCAPLANSEALSLTSDSLFSMIFSTMGNVQGPPGHTHAGGPINNPFAILSQLMNPANVQHGDAVFSQEALDRVITQLMEQNAGSTAPPPAPEAAIRSLPTRKVEESMMGSDGKAECSICMDNVEIGQEVTVLPCNHWFHRECVTAWLKEHDTCPHCRKGITQPPNEAQRSQSEQPPSNSRRPSHRRTSSITLSTSPGVEGSRRNPITVPESPRDIRGARQQYFESRPGDHDRRQNTRQPSHSEGQRNDDGRTGSRGSSGSNSGGVGGWIRNHLPSF
jgi:E3 ubiquitin-protein ligase RNF115/126